MFVKSKIKRSVGWCWQNGKSFQLGDRIVNCLRFGADINLEADGTITEDFAEMIWNKTVYYYYHITEKKLKE